MRVHLVPFMLWCCLLTPAAAQVPAVSDWRAAIEQVQKAGGWKAYLREAQKPDTTAPQTRASVEMSLAEATRLVLERHPEISQRLTGVDLVNPSWRQLSAEQRHALIARHRLIHDVKSQFYAAHAAQAWAQLQAEVVEINAIATELSTRLRKAGNLNAFHLLEEQLKSEAALIVKTQADDRAIQERERLLQLIGFTTASSEIRLATEIKISALRPTTTREKLLSLLAKEVDSHTALPADLAERLSLARQALSRHAARLKQHDQYQKRILPMRQQLLDEAVLHYNGMIIAVFDLLKEAEHQLQSVQKSLHASADLLRSESELELELALLHAHLAQIGRTS